MSEPVLSIDLIEDDVRLFSFTMADNRVECITNFIQHEQELYPNQLHIQGNAKNQVGKPALRQVFEKLGRYFGVKTVIIQGGRRTTGRYKGQVPTLKVIPIPEV